jgi:hypothetical protein
MGNGLQKVIECAGKTHTIMGSAQCPGIVPRAINRIFDSLSKNVRCRAAPAMQRNNSTFIDLQAHGTSSVYMTVVDLYNDNFLDLLDPSLSAPRNGGVSPTGKQAGGFLSPRSSHRGNMSSILSPRPIVYSAPNIRKHVSVKTTATGVTLQGVLQCCPRSNPSRAAGSPTLRMPVKTAAEAMRLVETGMKSRATAETNCNEHSSRSHCIIVVEVQRFENIDTVTVGRLFLVDLAGSERLDCSGVTGRGLKETQHINSSLSALGDVLHALSSRSKGVVPYRNSKLTMLLQDALGGNTKTVMITCIPQNVRASGEISTALAWSARARTIQNKAVRNVDSGGDSELAVLSVQVQEFKRSLMRRALELQHVEGSSSVQKLCESVPEETQKLHEALKAVMNGHNMLLEASASKLSGLNETVCRLSESSTAAKQQLEEQEQTILQLQHALECALAEQRSMRRQSDGQHQHQQQTAKIALLEDALAKAESARDTQQYASDVVAARDAEIEELKRQLNEKDAELRSRSLQEETVTLVLDKFVQDNMRLQEQLLEAQENSLISAWSGSRRSSRSSLSSIASSVRFSLESSSRSSTGRRSSGVDGEAALPLLQAPVSALEAAETEVIECKNLDTGCMELVSAANPSLNSFGKRRRGGSALDVSQENTAPNSSPGKLHFLDEAKQVPSSNTIPLDARHTQRP